MGIIVSRSISTVELAFSSQKAKSTSNKSLDSLLNFAVKNNIKIAASPVGQSQLGEGLEKLVPY